MIICSAHSSMIELTESRIDEALPKIENGLRKYCWIQDNIHKCDVSRSRLFQNAFNRFYRVRRDGRWQHQFYKLMETGKASGITFPQALKALLQRTSRVEASFASKLVATIDPNMPVIDKFVLGNFGLHLPHYNSPNRERRCIDVYDRLCNNYGVLIKSAEGLLVCEKFLTRFPWAQITDIKKIDLVLWQIRDGKA